MRGRISTVWSTFLYLIVIGLLLPGCQFTTTPSLTDQNFAANAQNSPLPITNENKAIFYELAVRALNRQYGFMGEQKVQVLVGELPPGWPLRLPLFNKTRIIGSIIATEWNHPKTQIYVDVAGAMEAVIDAYRTYLSAQGFREIAPIGMSLPAPSPTWRWHNFCNKEQDMALLVEKASDTTARVTLTMQNFLVSPCITHTFSYVAPLPEALTVPPDTVVLSSGSGSNGEGSSFLEQTLESSLSIQAFMAQYVTQLQENGWQMVETGNTDIITWGVWRFKDERDEDWIGTIWISGNLIAPTRKHLKIQVDRVPKQ